jgi:predicted small integral membrane protein
MVLNEKKLSLNKITILLLVISVWFWEFSAFIHDVWDPSVNLPFLKMVLAGSTSAKTSFHITSSGMIAGIFWLEKIYELIFLCVLLYAMLKYINSKISNDEPAKDLMCFGLMLIVVKYLVLFLALAGEWFFLWQTFSNDQTKSGIFVGAIVAIMIYIKLDHRVFEK